MFLWLLDYGSCYLWSMSCSIFFFQIPVNVDKDADVVIVAAVVNIVW